MSVERSIIHIGGSPGSGKSHLAEAVARGLRQEKDISAERISLGDRLRHIGRGVIWSAYQAEIQYHLTSPATTDLPFDDDIVERVVGDALSEPDIRDVDVLILDGYPRYPLQVDTLAYLALLGGRCTPGALVTKVDDNTALARMLKRGHKREERAMTSEQAQLRLALHYENYPATLMKMNKLATSFTTRQVDTSGSYEQSAYLGLKATLEILGEPLS